eukprot:gene37290-46014_t
MAAPFGKGDAASARKRSAAAQLGGPCTAALAWIAGVSRSVGIYEAKSRFSALIELVEQGEEVRITRHGKEVVRMLHVRRRPVISDEQIARELGQMDAFIDGG